SAHTAVATGHRRDDADAGPGQVDFHTDVGESRDEVLLVLAERWRDVAALGRAGRERALAAERRDGHRALVGRGEAHRCAVVVAGGHDHERARAPRVGDGGLRRRIRLTTSQAHVDEVAAIGHRAVDRLGDGEVRRLRIVLAEYAIAAQRHAQRDAEATVRSAAARRDDAGHVRAVVLAVVA